MFLLNTIRKQRLRFGLLLVLLATLIGGFLTTTQAQSQEPPVCRIFEQVRVCGDGIEEDSFLVTIFGNELTLGHRDGPAMVRVKRVNQPHPNLPPDAGARAASFTLLSADRDKGLARLRGDIHFVNDPTDAPMIKSLFNAAGSRRGDLEVHIGLAEILNPLGAPEPGLLRNELLQLNYLSFARNGFVRDLLLFGGKKEELAKIDVGINLKSGELKSTVVVPTSKVFPADKQYINAEVQCTFRLDKFGEPKGLKQLSGMEVRAGGLRGKLKGVQELSSGNNLQAQSSAASLQQSEDQGFNFEAEALEFSRADNPDLPSLDPTNPDLLFSLQGIQYKDGQFSVKGGAVGIPDWQVSRAFKLTNQQVRIETNKERSASTLVISSTLAFPAGSVATDSRTFPMAISIGSKLLPDGNTTTAITGTLLTSARPALDLGPLTISTPAKTELVFDPSQNFFGLKADQVTLKWDSGLGGGSGVQSNMRLGVDKDNNVSFGFGGGGGITLPPLRSSVLTVQVSGGIINSAGRTELFLTGNADLKLPGNGNVKPGVTMFIRSGTNVSDFCSPTSTSCKKRFEYSFSRFEFNLAGFGIGVLNARGTSDGGFAVDSATLKAPIGVKSIGGSIQNLLISGSGNVSITGGSVELPPLQIGGFSLAGVKGSFLKTATGYEFKGAGTVPLPGLEPNSNKKITGEVVVRSRPDGSFTGFGVSIAFNTGSPGIPIASTGMELTQLRGGFDVNSGTVKITVGMVASSLARFGPLPAVTADGTASLQFQPFQLTANAKLSVLVIQVAEASVGIGHQQGFNGGPGFNVSFDINFVLARGETELRIGPATLSNGQRKTIIAASAAYTVGIKRSAIFPLMPPGDITVARLEFKGGTFMVKGKGETLGLKARAEANIPGPFDPSMTVFVDLQTRKVDVTDTGDYQLIDGATVRARAAQGVTGYSARTLSTDESRALNRAGKAQVQQETLPVVLDHTGTALFGISYPAGSTPNLRLQLPDGSILTEQSVDPARTTFLRYSDGVTEPHELAFVLTEAMPGAYRLIVDDAPTQYQTVSYMINADPVVSEVAVTCGGAPVEGVSVTCDGAAAGSTATATWTAQDTDSPTATVQLAYAPVADDGSANLNQLTVVADNLPLGAGSFTWELGDVPTGTYVLVVTANDSQNAPVEVAATTAIRVADQRAPAAPQGVTAKPQPGELLVEWTPNTERDVAGYEIGFGIVEDGVADSPARFIYTRDMGAKERAITGGDVYDAKLWGLSDNQEIFFGLRAYDRSGNTSEWTLARAKPWALAPDAWTPTPDGALAASGAVEVAFATALDVPVNAALPSDLLQVRHADGSLVAGRLEVLTVPEDEQVVGVRFVPEQPLRAGESYTATLAGGVNSIRSLDGRQMPQDYVWSFQAQGEQVQQQSVFLPLVAR